MIRTLRVLIYLGVLILSYPASWVMQLWYWKWGPDENRKYTPTHICVLCGGPMVRDFRPERDARGPKGQIKRVPEDTLAWWRCPPDDGCGKSYQGEVKT